MLVKVIVGLVLGWLTETARERERTHLVHVQLVTELLQFFDRIGQLLHWYLATERERQKNLQKHRRHWLPQVEEHGQLPSRQDVPQTHLLPSTELLVFGVAEPDIV